MEDLSSIIKESLVIVQELLLELSDIGNELSELQTTIEEIEEATNSSSFIAKEVSIDVQNCLKQIKSILEEIYNQKEVSSKVAVLLSQNEEIKKATIKLNHQKSLFPKDKEQATSWKRNSRIFFWREKFGKAYKADYDSFLTVLRNLLVDYEITDVEFQIASNRILGDLDPKGRKFITYFEFISQNEYTLEYQFHNVFVSLFGKKLKKKTVKSTFDLQSRIEQLELEVKKLQEEQTKIALSHRAEILRIQKEYQDKEKQHISEINLLKQKLNFQPQEHFLALKEKEEEKDFLSRQLQLSNSKVQYLDKELLKERELSNKLSKDREKLFEENQRLQQEINLLYEKLKEPNIDKSNKESPKIPRALEIRRLSQSMDSTNPPTAPLNVIPIEAVAPEPKKSYFRISFPKISSKLNATIIATAFLFEVILIVIVFTWIFVPERPMVIPT